MFLSILHVSDMQKRTYCYNYIHSSQCYCSADIDQLLNESVKIVGLREYDSNYKNNLEIINKIKRE